MPGRDPTEANGRERLPALSGLRFLLAAYLLVFHFAPVPASPLAARVVGGGYVGTSLLFALSGFVLARARPRPMSPDDRARFWAARLARLYPAYLLAWALCVPLHLAAVAPGDGTEGVRRLAGAALSLAMLQAWVPHLAQAWNEAGWATSAALFFYAVFPFAVGRLSAATTRRVAVFGIGAWLASLALPALALAASPAAAQLGPTSYGTITELLKCNPAVRLPEFLAGCALGVLHGRGALTPRSAPAAIAAGAAAVAAGILTPGLPYVLLHNGLLLPATALLLAGIASDRGRFARALGWRPLAALGEAGFAIYVLQFPIRALCIAAVARTGLEPRSWGSLAAVCLATVATAVAVRRWVELPAQRAVQRAWGARASARGERAAAA